MKILLLDTETTDLERARLVQLAYKNLATGTVVNEYFKPPVAITFGSMAIHHITNDMVADKPSFKDSDHHATLSMALQDAVLVAHNAAFDIQVLQNEGIAVPVHIDTLRVARHVLATPQHALQYLRYALGLKVAPATAHDALGDILVLEALYAHLTEAVAKKFNLTTNEDVVKKMIALTKDPVLLTTLGFGKYRGKTYEEVAKFDRGYLEWLLGSESQKKIEDQNEELVHTLKHYLQAADDLSDVPF